MNNNDWIEHKIYVLNNLDALKEDTKTIKDDLSKLKTTFGIFQTKVITIAVMASGILSVIISIAPLFVGAH